MLVRCPTNARVPFRIKSGDLMMDLPGISGRNRLVRHMQSNSRAGGASSAHPQSLRLGTAGRLLKNETAAMNFGPTTYGLGLLAGALSTLSPCVLPLVPVLLAAAVSAHRWGALALGGGLALSFTL